MNKMDNRSYIIPVLELLQKSKEPMSISEIRLCILNSMAYENKKYDGIDKGLNYVNKSIKSALSTLTLAGLVTKIGIDSWECTYQGLYHDNIKNNNSNIESIIYLGRKKRGVFEKYRNIMIKSMLILNKNKEILNINYSCHTVKSSSSFSILLSDNGNGKSFALGQIAYYLNSYNEYIMKNNNNDMKYSFYSLEYFMGEELVKINYSENKWVMYVDDNIVNGRESHYLPKTLLAITQTIDDKFPFYIKNNNSNFTEEFYTYLGPKSKPDMIDIKNIRNSIINSINGIFYHGSPKIINTIMKYIGYNSSISFEFTNPILDILQSKYKGQFFGHTKITQIRTIDVNKNRYILSVDEDLELMDKNIYSRIANELNLLLEESSIGDLKIIFSKNGEDIEYEWLSSGERVLIESIFSIGAYINGETILLIDEPENSLHPKWQTEYIKLIADIFSHTSANIHAVIATHSPSIVLQSAEHESTIINISNTNGSRKYDSYLNNARNSTLEDVLYYDFSFSNNRTLALKSDMVKLIDYIEKKLPIDEEFTSIFKRLNVHIDHSDTHDILKKFLLEVENYYENF